MKKLLSALLFIPSIAIAQPTVIKAARMFDGNSDTLLRNAVVVVEGNHITAVNPASVPANARVIDLGDATILPGFIDAHVHLTGESGPNYYLDFFQEMMRHPPEQAL